MDVNIFKKNSPIAVIGAELEKVNQVPNVGMFIIKTANQTIQEAALRPNPEALWLSLWYEGEVCCLFADSNLGKSIYAQKRLLVRKL